MEEVRFEHGPPWPSTWVLATGTTAPVVLEHKVHCSQSHARWQGDPRGTKNLLRKDHRCREATFVWEQGCACA
jgi:hypothetical protein